MEEATSVGKKPEQVNLPTIQLGDIDFEKLLNEENPLPAIPDVKPKKEVNGLKTNVIHSCRICNLKFDSVDLFKKHFATHKNAKIKNVFQCFMCQEQFGQKYQLINHLRSHKDRKFRLSAISFSQMHNRKRKLVVHNINKQYECPDCKEILSSVDHFEYHKETKCGTFFKCSICHEIRNSAEDLDAHVRTHRERPFKCNLCDATFFKGTTLKDHIRVHTGEKPFQCDLCTKCFSHQTTLRRHKRTHTGEKRYQCEICNQIFTHRSSRKRHMARIHASDGATTTETVVLKTSTVPAPPPPEEENCKIEFQMNSEEMKDRNVIQIRVGGQFSEGYKPIAVFKCGVCTEGFPDFPTLQSHMEVHETTTFKAISDMGNLEICHEQPDNLSGVYIQTGIEDPNMKLKQEHQAKRHNRWDGSALLLPKASSYQSYDIQRGFQTTTFQIDDQAYIEDAFDTEVAPDYSYAEYNTSKPPEPLQTKPKAKKAPRRKSEPDDGSKLRPYQCTMCTASFAASGVLRSHMVTHTGEKPYKCDICNESFRYRSTRMRHMQVHTGKVKFQCSVCPRSYSRRENLEKHMVIHT